MTYDTQSVYGHSELDLLLPLCEDRLPDEFFTAYHNVLPKAEGFHKRHTFYCLYFAIINWNHQPEETIYQDKAVAYLKDLLKITNGKQTW